MIAIAERQGGHDSLCYARIEHFAAKPAQRPRAKLLAAADAGRLAAMLTGLGHPDRIRMARAILAGACTHRELAEALGLKTGPLYHHLRELERAGLLVIAGRNRYDLSDFGRVCVLATTVLGTWREDGRTPWRTVNQGPR